MRDIIVKTEKLSKSYGKFKALDEVDMTVYQGDIYGLIGRNGAGKTTIMKIISGLAVKTEGVFEVFSKSGEASAEDKKRIGCLIENPAFFGNMTAYQNLKYYAIQKGIADTKQIDDALALVGLTNTGKKKYRQFSLGMKQRLGIALAVLDNPDLIILDEPINGLDPIGISELRETFKKLNSERGITIIISSHILSELYAVANRFLFIENGKVLKEITKEDLEIACKRCIVVKTSDTKTAAVVLEETLGITDYSVVSSGELHIYEKNLSPEQLTKALFENGVSISGVFENIVSLEDYFKSLVEVK